MKFFNSHLSTEKIADAIEKRLAASETESFNAHLESCQYCANEYKTLARSIGLMRRDKSQEAPADALNFAFNLFRARKQFVPREETVGQKILAALKLDVSPFSPVFGERSAAASAERQMLFEAEELAVDLRIRFIEDGFNLEGQIIGNLLEQAVVILANQNYAVEDAVDAENRFSFPKIPAGIYQLSLRIGEQQIIIEDLTIE